MSHLCRAPTEWMQRRLDDGMAFPVASRVAQCSQNYNVSRKINMVPTFEKQKPWDTSQGTSAVCRGLGGMEWPECSTWWWWWDETLVCAGPQLSSPSGYPGLCMPPHWSKSFIIGQKCSCGHCSNVKIESIWCGGCLSQPFLGATHFESVMAFLHEGLYLESHIYM